MKLGYKARIGWSLLILLVAYMVYISVPYAVSKHYEGTVYNTRNKALSHLPVTIQGKVYRGVFQTNEFMGTVKIGRNTYSVHTQRQSRMSILMQTLIYHNPLPFAGYPYMGIVMRIDRQQSAVTSAFIQMSGHFNTMTASTHAISKTYGAQAFYRATVR